MHRSVCIQPHANVEPNPRKALRPQLSICIFLKSDSLLQSVVQSLKRVSRSGTTESHRYVIAAPRSEEEFFRAIEQDKQQLDCLILQVDKNTFSIANWLHGHATLLPAVLVQSSANTSVDSTIAPNTAQRTFDSGSSSDRDSQSDSDFSTAPASDSATPSAYLTDPSFTYHRAEVKLPDTLLDRLDSAIEQAIAQFINLSPTCRVSPSESASDLAHDLTTQNFLMLQQRRLAEKLKERLGYLGVYYKRNPQNFLRYLPPDERQELLDKLQRDYREIVLCYFSDDGTLNQRIDDFVNTAFFADISVSQVVETHMELMDEFSKQLKLEGRSEEILLDYRLTLIDTIAHLCEMYRRSIPRES